jgi:PAS domain S-box-containing protein
MPHRSPKILLVHDADGSLPEIYGLLLKTDIVQFEVDQVTTSLAFRRPLRNYYDVCVIDSPGKEIWVLEALRRVGFDTPIMMITSDSAYEVLNAMRHGAADCLVRDTLTAGALEESICVLMERARYEKYKSACARRYAGLVENSSAIIYTHDLQGNPTFLSKAGERLIGYTCEEILKTNFCKIISPEWIDSVWRTTMRMLADRKPASYQAVMISKEGERIPVDVTMHLIYRRGNPVEVQGIVRDLSAQVSIAPALAENEQLSRVSFII